MNIGQIFRVFDAAEIFARLGGWNAIPPNCRWLGDYKGPKELWKLLLHDDVSMLNRQPRVARGPWKANVMIEEPTHYEGASAANATLLLPCVKLFFRPDLSGVMVVLGAPREDYEPAFFSFYACAHGMTRGEEDRDVCLDCGFWTRISSS